MSWLEMLQAQARELNRQLAHELWLQESHRHSPLPASPVPPSSSSSAHPRSNDPAVEGSPRTPLHPTAVLAPSYRPPRFANPWKGDHSITRLNAFIRQARAWILGVGKFGANDDLASAAPDVHLLVLSVFSTEPGKGQETSAADWADAQFRRAINAARVLTLNDLFRLARHRWPDPGFAARVDAELTALRQGIRHAMEFLSLFEAKVLEYEDDGANIMTERDQAARFLRALNPAAQQLCHTQIGHRDPFFHTSGVFSAGLHPTLEELSRWASAVGRQPLGVSRTVRAARSPPRTENADQHTRQRERWVARAIEWQGDHPAHQRSEWVRISSAKRTCPATLRCYNCGLGGHFADDCKNTRVSPNQVVVASIAQYFDIGPSGHEADEVVKLESDDQPVRPLVASSHLGTLEGSRGDLVSSFRALLIECLSSPLDQQARDETRDAPVVRTPRTAKATGRGARIERSHRRRSSFVASDAGPPPTSFGGPRALLASTVGIPSDKELEHFVDVGAISLLEEQKLADEPPSATGNAEPRILRVKNVLLWTTPSGRTLRCLLDSGAEIDVIDSRIVKAESSFVLSSLMAPLHLRLGTGDATDRLSLFATAPFASGALDLGLRPFFVGMVSGYDTILGLPFLADSGMLVGAHQYAIHSGPFQPATTTSHAPIPSLEPIPWGTAVRSLYPLASDVGGDDVVYTRWYGGGDFRKCRLLRRQSTREQPRRGVGRKARRKSSVTDLIPKRLTRRGGATKEKSGPSSRGKVVKLKGRDCARPRGDLANQPLQEVASGVKRIAHGSTGKNPEAAPRLTKRSNKPKEDCGLGTSNPRPPSARPRAHKGFFFYFTGAHKLQSFGLAGTARKRAKRGYKATTASNWVKVKPLRAKSAAQIKTRRAPNADSNGR
ncbi:BZ3500_MvSof-1268-A1-R1_Chr6-2g08586 [Microbotryum saponariae]|uniref:BZ3500_MvSof-1268-A1-R1_Chr6-2g08586 protein n=1 Tax=Microbotryum saponariae TaxID=289078 RepID=A0A2X0MGK8_9BASI|nr:BZ3500_MvSof-1268-A1-R1_Chr6-2g08586 [Microbotryum saponariae]SDA07858.1 BZ3501_MvSof-1269-A2-R1_Chr6-1g08295 [Microbotryum saponariae]